ncbi:MAG: hypothetical protein DIU65_06135 [Proteobacteria bacterium]|jgi:hypothetical protein|nr:MAG: hypothetical protein DIU65_06135 [Pseudomonadota bacterium]
MRSEGHSAFASGYGKARKVAAAKGGRKGEDRDVPALWRMNKPVAWERKQFAGSLNGNDLAEPENLRGVQFS